MLKNFLLLAFAVSIVNGFFGRFILHHRAKQINHLPAFGKYLAVAATASSKDRGVGSGKSSNSILKKKILQATSSKNSTEVKPISTSVNATVQLVRPPLAMPVVLRLETFQVELQSYRKLNASRKIMNAIEQYQSEGKLNQEMILATLKTLQRMNRIDLCLNLVSFWTDIKRNKSTPLDIVAGKELNTTVACIKFFVRECCKQKQLQRCESVIQAGFGVNLTYTNYFNTGATAGQADTLADASGDLQSAGPGLYFHAADPDLSILGANRFATLPTQIHLEVYAIFADLALGYFLTGKFNKGVAALEFVASLKLDYHAFKFYESNNILKEILKSVLREGSHAAAMQTINVLLKLDGLEDYDSSQIIASNYMQSLSFVKGAVSMDTLPVGDRPEVAFIGRSNVGKSSLINMVCNRKKLAFTSKTPGKTSEFNYFAASGLIGAKNENVTFYLVDLPGVGFAEVTSTLRRQWLLLLREFATERSSLRVIFHLVDSRHGFLDADEECLSLLTSLPDSVEYVIVLTKVDKMGKGANKAVQPYVLEKIKKELASRTSRKVSIIETSSEGKYGGVDVWSSMLRGITRDPVVVV